MLEVSRNFLFPPKMSIEGTIFYYLFWSIDVSSKIPYGRKIVVDRYI